jgi:DNA-binding LacI/PurR family transcriptional regulator
MAGLEDVARHAGVSPITVSRVIRNHPSVRPATAERVRQAIDELGYIPNAAARGLKQSRSGLIALVVTNMTSPFFADVARGADDATREAGLTLLLINSNDDPQHESDILRVIGEHRVDGIVLVPSPKAAQSIAGKIPATMPLVLFDWKAPGVEADIVRCDVRTAARDLTTHLIDQGHRRLAFVGGLPGLPPWRDRVAGYRDALDAARIPFDASLIVDGHFRRADGATAVETLLAFPERPTAIIAANAQVSLGVLEAISAYRIPVPQEIEIATMDDPLPTTSFWQRLPCVVQPGYEMGKAAAQLLIARLDDSSPRNEARELIFPAVLRPRVAVAPTEKTPG